MTRRIELERRARSLEHRIPTGKRPEATFALEAERNEPPFDLGAVRHDDIDVGGQVEAGRPVGDRKPTDHDPLNRDRTERSIDDRRDFEHLLRRVRNVGSSAKRELECFEIGADRMTGHSVASPKRSRPLRRRPGLTIGPSVAGASVSTISA
jgi:hypothetical protein